MFGTIWWLITCGCVRKKKKKYKTRKVPKKGCCGGLCCTITADDIRRLSPAYKRADEYAQFFLASGKGMQLRRLLVRLGCKRKQVTRMFKLFMRIDEDDSGMITLDEFFKYLNMEWSPFIGRAFHAMDSDGEGMSADQVRVRAARNRVVKF